MNLLGNDIGNGNLGIYKNDANLQNVYFNNPQRAYFLGGIQLLTIADCDEGDIIRVKAFTQQSKMAINVDENRTNLNLVRIG